MRGRPAADGPLHQRTVEALARARRDGGKAIVLAQPARVVALPRLPRVRPRLELPAAATCRSCSTGAARGALALPPLRPRRAGRPARAPTAARWPLARPAPATERLRTLARRGRVAPCPCFGSTPTRRRGAARHLEILRRFDEAESGVLVGTQMVAKGHDFPDVVLASSGRRRHASLPGLPRRGAHLRPVRAARRPQRPGGARRAGARADARPGRPSRSATPPDTTPRGSSTRELERRRDASLPAVRAASRGSSSRRTSPGAPRPSRGSVAARSRPSSRRASSSWARRRAFGVRGRYRRRLLLKGPSRAGRRRAVRDPLEAAAGRALRDATLSRGPGSAVRAS